jgi:transcriptional regulator with XRE-family HTH domain
MNSRIKELRTVLLKEKLGRKITQQEFADKLGLSQNYIWQIENGDRVPSERTLSDICREFGCNEIWLRTGEGDPFQEESRQEQIMRFAAQTVNGSDEFKKAFVSMLAKMDADDWENLAKLFRKLSGEIKKE